MSAPTLAVFASVDGPDAAERAGMLSAAGTYLARHGANLVVMAIDRAVCTPVITSAHAAGADVTIIACNAFTAPRALTRVTLERIEDPTARMRRVITMSDALIGLPGGMASTAALFRTWALAGGGKSGKPVALLNHMRAFEVMRGFSNDVFAHAFADAERFVLVAETIDELWSRLDRVLKAQNAG